MIPLLAGFLRGWLDLTDFNQTMWLDRFAWHRQWKATRFATFHLPWDRWHTLAVLHAYALIWAGMQCETREDAGLALLVYYCSKTVFYESLLKADPVKGLLHFWHAFKTPWRFDP